MVGGGWRQWAESGGGSRVGVVGGGGGDDGGRRRDGGRWMAKWGRMWEDTEGVGGVVVGVRTVVAGR